MRHVLLCLLCATLTEKALAVKPIRLRSSPACPRGEKPLQIEGKPKSCDVTNNATCPADYDCLFEQNVCCPKKKPTLFLPKSDSKYCGPDGRVFRDRNNKTQTCTKDSDCLPPTLCLDLGFCCLLRLDQEPPPVGCPFGSRPLKNANNQIITCNPGTPNACPGNSLCYQDSVDNTHKCCGKDPGEGCPSGSRAVKTNNNIRPCTPGSSTSACPTGALCQWSYLTDRYQCCESDDGCPTGTAPLLNPSKQVTTCTLDGQQRCPTNFKCEFNFWTASYQCCGRDLGLCPIGQVPYLEPANGQVRSCTGFTCPSGYACQQSSTGQSVCCGATGTCPSGLILVTDTQGRPSTCSLNGAVSCTAPATCMAAVGGAPTHYLCCRTNMAPQMTCPSNRTPYPSAQNPQRCTINQAGCPWGTTCEISPTGNTAICCSGTNPLNGCPSGWVLQGGVTSYCSPTNPTSSCQFGSSCLQSSVTANQYICCRPQAINQYQCPVGTPLLQGTQHTFCNFGQACPAGSVCQQAVNKVGTYICCKISSTQQYFCPTGQPLKVNNQYRFCTISTGCGAQHTCMSSTTDTRVQLCCSISSTISYTCSSGAPYNIGGRFQYCVTNPSVCPSGYTCQTAVEDFNIRVCCSSGVIVPVCPTGTPLRLGNQYQYCTTSSAICGSGYSCQTDRSNPSLRICCSMSNTGAYTCPNNAVPYLVGSSYQLCTNNPSICVAGYSCMPSTNSPSTSLCCAQSSTSTYSCPSNAVPYQLSGLYRFCSSSPLVCPTGYSCQIATNNAAVKLCCSSTTGSYTCSNSGTPLMIGSQYQFCATSPSICGAVYSCVAAANNPGIQICCSSGNSNAYVCPIGTPVQIGGAYQFCANNVAFCTALQGTCQTATNNPSVKICCSTGGATTYTCSTGVPYQVGGQYQFCTSNPAVCLSGYSCQTASNSINVRLCCSGSSTSYICPNNGIPLLIGSQYQLCATNPNVCGLGYSCQTATNNPSVRICCSSTGTTTYTCPSGGTAVVANNNQNQFCSTTNPNCPLGSTCRNAANQASVTICCYGGSNTNAPQCPSGVPYQTAGNYQYCNQASPTCISGYTCRAATNIANTFVCCSGGGTSAYTCPNNRQTYISATGQPIFCSVSSPTNCPATTTCMTSVNNPQYAVCCITQTNTNVCPTGQTALLLSNGQPQFCTGPGGTCNSFGYTCQVSPTLGQFVCCGTGSSSQARCANGASMYQPSTGQTYTCNPATTFGCPTGYQCSASTVSSVYVCCLQGSTQAQCPVGWSPYQLNGVARTCSGPTDTSCPSGYSCAQSNMVNRFLCCQFGTTSLRCYNGANAQLVNGRPQVCNQAAPNCQAGYSCQASTQSNTFICCQSSSALLQCSNGATPFSANGQNQYCTQPGSNVGCPVNYACQQSTRTGVYICCSGSGTSSYCPSNLQPYYVNGQPQQCNLFSPNCGSGYTCQRSPGNSALSYCCQGPRCPGGVTIGSPQTCVAGSSTCPFGQSCTQSSNIPGTYLCCQGSSTTARCVGRSTLIVGGLAQSCQLPNTCVAGYECSSYTTTGQYLCCAVQRTDSPVCPNNRDPYRDPTTKQYHYCDNTNFACPAGYVCKRQLNSVQNPNRYVCCSPIPSCQTGWLPYIDSSTRQPKTCSPFQQNMACSPSPGLPYRCQQSTVPNTYLCCMEGARSIGTLDDKGDGDVQLTTPRLPVIVDNTTMIQIEDPNAWTGRTDKPSDDGADDGWVVWGED